MKTIQLGFYITRTYGLWELVTPFRRIQCATLQEAVETLYK